MLRGDKEVTAGCCHKQVITRGCHNVIRRLKSRHPTRDPSIRFLEDFEKWTCSHLGVRPGAWTQMIRPCTGSKTHSSMPLNVSPTRAKTSSPRAL